MGKRKDARWQYAFNGASLMGLDYEDFTAAGWQKLLDAGGAFMVRVPEAKYALYEQWKERNG